MDGSKYLAKIDGLLKQNRLLGIVIVVMLIWNVFNFALIIISESETKIVVIPIGSEGMQIGNGRASENYLRRMARYITTMIGTYSAASARGQFMELVDLFSSEKTNGAYDKFSKIAVEIERFPSISSHVRWSGDNPLRYTDNLLQVKVVKDRLVNGVLTESKEKVYCIDYAVTGTRFNVLNIRERDWNNYYETVCDKIEDSNSDL